jgi:integrase
MAHPAYPAFVQTLFWTGLRPSEAAGLQWGDVDLDGARPHVQRSRHLYDYGAPKTESADHWVELFPSVVETLRALQRLRVEPDTPVVATTTGTPIEPKTFSAHWYAR